jgi:thymidylate kinase
MIIELFGPSGVGKTTLSHGIKSVLETRGFSVRLNSSARPSEKACHEQACHEQARRPVLKHYFGGLTSPMSRGLKAIDAIGSLVGQRSPDEPAAELLTLLPDVSFPTQLRYRRYLSSLGASWAQAMNQDEIAIFDQAYLSALCSIGNLGGSTSSSLRRAFDTLPRPDLLVILSADRALIKERLLERLKRQSILERMFELDLTSTLKQSDIAANITDWVKSSNREDIVLMSGRDDPEINGRAIAGLVEARLARSAV